MASSTFETGLLLGEFPYIRIGAGPKSLLVVPGTQVDNSDPGFVVRKTYQAAFSRLATGHTLYLVNRKRNLPPEYRVADMAADYTRVLQAIGPAHVLGFSGGGLIAQHIALQAPELVERVAIVSAAARLSTAGRRFAELVIELAEAGRWVDIEAELGAYLFVNPAAQQMTRRAMRWLGRLYVKPPQYGHDLITTMRADLQFDSRALLPGLRVPTLVLGGGADPFFPAELLHEAADLLPNATLEVYEGAGHGLFKFQKRRMEDDVLGFLRPAPALAAV